MRTTNKRAREAVDNLQEFKASNLSGEWKGSYYVVLSYNWYPIFAYNQDNNQWYENMDKYSRSTTRQQSQCRPEAGTVWVHHEYLKRLIGI